jgi:putative acetyltransferase
MAMIEIKRISPFSDEVRELFRLLDSHNRSHCPPEICHLTQPEELEQDNSTLLGVFRDGVLCGMGGLKYYDSYAEVTRMFIKEKQRGNGLAVELMKALEKAAANRGLRTLKLETSDRFKRAYRLYLRYGFNLCEPFGEYIDKPYNSYMEKSITDQL